MNARGRTGSVGSNIPNLNNYEQGENWNPFTYGSVLIRSRIMKHKQAPSHDNRKRHTINEEFKPRNPLIQEGIPAKGYFLNLDYLIEKRKAIDLWKALVVLSLISEAVYTEEGRDVNAICSLIVNSVQGIVYN